MAANRRRQAELWSRYRADRSTANRDALVSEYEKLVNWYSKRVRSRLPIQFGALDEDDLLQHLRMGLTQAVEEFQDHRGSVFTTFAYWKFRGAITRMMNRATWLSGRVMQQAKKQGTEDELPVTHQMRDEIDPKMPCPAEAAISIEQSDWLREAIRRQGSRTAHIMRRRYWDGWTLREIGREVGISFERVRQIINETIERIRSENESALDNDFHGSFCAARNAE